MKKVPKTSSFKSKVLKEGSIALFYGSKKIAVITPELFTPGWAKNTAGVTRQKGIQGLVKLAQGSIGLKTTVRRVKEGVEVLEVLTPLADVEMIHVRQVVNLPYGEWEGKPYELGKKKGIIPIEPPADIKIAGAESKTLKLGPGPLLGGKSLQVKAPGLQMVLQDNRQWTPFLHIFVTRGEASDPAWVWNKGKKKEYRMVLGLV